MERVVFAISVLFSANLSVVCWTEWTFADLKYLGAALLPAPPLANYTNQGMLPMQKWGNCIFISLHSSFINILVLLDPQLLSVAILLSQVLCTFSLKKGGLTSH